jgi:hypothetical protein
LPHPRKCGKTQTRLKKQYSMQKYKLKSEIAKNFSKNFSAIQNVTRATQVQNWTTELENKTFQERYEILFYLGIALAYNSQALSAWSSYAYVESIVRIKANSHELITFVTCTVLVLIESVKYVLVRTTFVNVYALRPVYPYPIILLSVVWSLGSMYLSVAGSSELAKDKKQETQITMEQAGREKALKNEIAQIQNTDSYKTLIWDGKGGTAKMLTQAGKDLVAKREAELDSLRKTYQVKTKEFQQSQSDAVKKYNWFFSVFEILFLFVTAGTFYYKRMSAIEAKIAEYENELHEPSTDNVQIVRTKEVQSEPVRTDSTNQVYEPSVRTKIEKEPIQTESAQSVDLAETEYLDLIAQFTNGRKNFLEKYKDAVKTILHLRKTENKSAVIEKAVKELHQVGRTTFYSILQHLKTIEKI